MPGNKECNARLAAYEGDRKYVTRTDPSLDYAMRQPRQVLVPANPGERPGREADVPRLPGLVLTRRVNLDNEVVGKAREELRPGSRASPGNR